MKNRKLITIALLTSFYCHNAFSQVSMNFQFSTPYGANSNVGKYVEVNGIQMYYEEYGSGEPLLLIHGNGESILSMGNQIDYFKNRYRVIIADSRGHGKSGLNTDSLTYRQLADDWAVFADKLDLNSSNIIGWSDGGIIGLILSFNHPNKVQKLVAMGANMRPDSSAIYTWAAVDVRKSKQSIQAKINEGDTTRNWNKIKQLYGLLADQPHLLEVELAKITASVLVIAGDKDIIREEHTVELFQAIPNAQLCIMPGETHYTPASNPDLFNSIVQKFIAEPFVRPDSDWTKW